jgi:ankyrin repeat protein
MIARGGDSDLENIKDYLSKDPNKFLIQSDDDESLINKTNIKGLTPLYVACQNGNEKVVRFLLENGANPFKKVTFNNNVDSSLEVAVRFYFIL